LAFFEARPARLLIRSSIAELFEATRETVAETFDPVPSISPDVQSVSFASCERIQILSRWLPISATRIVGAEFVPLLVAIAVNVVMMMISVVPAEDSRHGALPDDRKPDHGSNNDREEQKRRNQTTRTGARYSTNLRSSHHCLTRDLPRLVFLLIAAT
jgi:hypothetical protein